MSIKCYKCGFVGNRHIANYCRNCGEPLKKTPDQSGVKLVNNFVPKQNPPGEAMVHFNFAKGRMLSIKEEAPSGWRDVANELTLAVEKAGGNFPKLMHG